jgi:hypothetical protein
LDGTTGPDAGAGLDGSTDLDAGAGLDAAPPPDSGPLPDSGLPNIGIEVSPANPSVASGNTVLFTAQYVVSDGSRAAIPSGLSWVSLQTAIATIDAASGLATAKSAGDARIQASAGGLTGWTDLHVGQSLISGNFLIAPKAQSVDQGTSVVYTATALYTDGQTRTVASVTWSSSQPLIATINSVTGVADAQAPGTTTITGSADGTSFADTTTLTVLQTPPAPGAVGASCDASLACASILTCTTDATFWPGGYCTRDCTVDQLCPAGSSCYAVGSGGAAYYCIQNCTPAPNPPPEIQSSCRTGYCCFKDPATPQGACLAARGTTCN